MLILFFFLVTVILLVGMDDIEIEMVDYALRLAEDRGHLDRLDPLALPNQAQRVPRVALHQEDYHNLDHQRSSGH